MEKQPVHTGRSVNGPKPSKYSGEVATKRALRCVVFIWLAAFVSVGGLEAITLREAQDLITRGQFERVIAELEQQRDPSNPDSRVDALLGKAYALNRQFAAAEPLLEPIVKAADAEADLVVLFASVLWENGLLEEAESYYRKAAVESNHAAEATFPLAKLLLFKGQSEEAVPLLLKVRSRYPLRMDVALDLGRALLQTGDMVAAKGELEAFINFAPEHSEALYALGRVYQGLGDRDAAQAAFARFRVASDEDRQRTLVGGRWKAQLGKVAALLAKGEAEQALSLTMEMPQEIEVLRLKSRAQLGLGRAAEAIESLERAVSMDPSRTDVRLELGEAYRRQNERIQEDQAGEPSP